ncbi:MAG: hypothetical protein HY056_04750 [Proteobacteria bacterium]|nr:hypothetical protein [Pseudomonadota bacterium]
MSGSEAETIRQPRDLVESRVEKKYPVVEEIDGRVYLHAENKSAVDVALVALERRHPKRMDKGELVGVVKRNGFLANNASRAVSRIAKLVDDDNGKLRLLAPGRKRAEKIIRSALKDQI